MYSLVIRSNSFYKSKLLHLYSILFKVPLSRIKNMWFVFFNEFEHVRIWVSLFENNMFSKLFRIIRPWKERFRFLRRNLIARIWGTCRKSVINRESRYLCNKNLPIYNCNTSDLKSRYWNVGIGMYWGIGSKISLLIN